MTVDGSARGTRTTLAEGLRYRLPGLAGAADASAAAGRLERELLTADARVVDVTAKRFWLHPDGSCGLRYQVDMTTADGPVSAIVFGRVFETADAAAEYVARDVLAIPEARLHGSRSPWRNATAVVAEDALALHPFPLDPAVPTLPRAIQPESAHSLVPGMRGCDVRVEVVHHPRIGPYVLRYTFTIPDGPSAPARVYYAKTYTGAVGRRVAEHLRILTDDAPGDIPGTVRYPRPVCYSRPLGLLVTEALPGAALVPALLSDLRLADTAVPALHAAARVAVTDSGRTLAGLHARRSPAAPLRTAADELASLREDLSLVKRWWPDQGASLQHRLSVLVDDPPPVRTPVLSHGDFTPAQVLLAPDSQAIVDLDTLCWADPALDLGHYLAHLQLVCAKHEPTRRPPTAELAAAFLDGYRDLRLDPTWPDSTAPQRIDFYRRLRLGRTALRGCRALKDARAETAMWLLESPTATIRDVL